MPPFIVVWDNGHATGALPGSWETEEAADAAGAEWLAEMVAIDDDPEEAADAYSYEVIEKETQHTPEPWRLIPEFSRGIVGKNDRLASDCRTTLGIDEDRANARRIVACVNALQGIPTEALENGYATMRNGESVRLTVAEALETIAQHALMHEKTGLGMRGMALREVAAMCRALKGEK